MDFPPPKVRKLRPFPATIETHAQKAEETQFQFPKCSKYQIKLQTGHPLSAHPKFPPLNRGLAEIHQTPCPNPGNDAQNLDIHKRSHPDQIPSSQQGYPSDTRLMTEDENGKPPGRREDFVEVIEDQEQTDEMEKTHVGSEEQMERANSPSVQEETSEGHHSGNLISQPELRINTIFQDLQKNKNILVSGLIKLSDSTGICLDNDIFMKVYSHRVDDSDEITKGISPEVEAFPVLELFRLTFGSLAHTHLQSYGEDLFKAKYFSVVKSSPPHHVTRVELREKGANQNKGGAKLSSILQIWQNSSTSWQGNVPLQEADTFLETVLEAPHGSRSDLETLNKRNWEFGSLTAEFFLGTLYTAGKRGFHKATVPENIYHQKQVNSSSKKFSTTPHIRIPGMGKEILKN